MLLVTDLDGTFLHAPTLQAQSAYAKLSGHPELNIVWATGRSFDSVRPLLFDPRLPLPQAVICDVGTTCYVRPVGGDARSFLPFGVLDQEMSQRWPGHDEVLRRLKSFSCLSVQNVPQQHRLSFIFDDENYKENPQEISSILDAMADVLRPLGLAVSISNERYVDVLVDGVSKFSTLERLCAMQSGRSFKKPVPSFHLDDVVCAGDTENDLSLLIGSKRGIAVGNATASLKSELEDVSHVYHAKGDGVLGIVEGLETFGLCFSDPSPAYGKADFVLVYHRGPEEGIAKENGKQSPNGILSSLKGAFDDVKNGAWIYSGRSDCPSVSEGKTCKDLTVKKKHPVTEAKKDFELRTISTTAEEDAAFYHRFSKETLWPILFSQASNSSFSAVDYTHFVEVNRRFAEEAAATAAPNAKIWVHDYNLWLVPGLLRKIRPDLHIGFFLHTAFPGPEVFFSFPRADDVIASLLCCDLIGFHIPAYVESFARCATAHAITDLQLGAQVPSMPYFLRGMQGALATSSSTSSLRVRGHEIKLGTFPIGVDVEGIAAVVRSAKMRQRFEERRQERQDLKYVLSVERLDYVKAPVERVEAFAQLLEEAPHLHERVTLVSVCPLPNAGMRAYDEVKMSLERAIGSINARFQTLSWTPIITLFRSLPPSELYALYANSEVCFISPKRDGLNLVAKEYVAVRQALSRPGTLVLSEFAGVFSQADGAIPTHPYDPTSLKESLAQALELDAGDVQARHTRLARSLLGDNVTDWRDAFLRALDETALLQRSS